MHVLTSWFIRNPVAANLIMFLILVSGALAVSSMRIEGFPKLPADTLEVSTVFDGAYAEQVDRQITQKIERSVEGLAGIKTVYSYSSEGFSSVKIQKQAGYDIERLSDALRTRLDSIYGLPARAEKPVVTRNDFDFPALIVQLYGDTDNKTLQRLGSQVREALLAKPEISKINSWGGRQAEIRIEVQPSKLLKYKITNEEVVASIQQASLTYKAGALKTQGGTITLRTDSQAYHYRDFANITIVDKKDGRHISLLDVAQITDGFEDDNSLVRFNGQAAIGMEVLIGRKENLLEIAAVIKTTIADLQSTLPPDVSLVSWADSSHYITDRLELLKNNAIQGLMLVFVLLAIFLNLKLAFWVAMGIPISIAGALAVMGSDLVGYSLNDITTFGLIIALGILVDDAVVVGESIFTARKEIHDPIKGTEAGVKKVATATIFGVLTTVAAFFPMLLIDSALGKVLASFSGVVILALLFSLFESKFILPAHLAHLSIQPSLSNKRQPWWANIWPKVQDIAQSLLEGFKYRIYQPVLSFSINKRYTTLVFFISIATLGLGLMEAGTIRTVFFPDIPGQMINISMEMDPRSPHRLTLKNTNKIEAIGQRINLELEAQFNLNDKPIKHILTVVNDSYSVEIHAELTLPEERANLATLDILKKWQQAVGTLEGASELSFSASEETAGGFVLQLFSKNKDALDAASQAMLAQLREINGVSNIRDDLKQGKPELLLKLKPEAKYLGFNQERLASQIGSRFGGIEAQRLQRNGQEVKVIVQDRIQARNTLADLMEAKVINDKGHWFPLLSVAEIESSYTTDYIARRDGQRVNTIRAYVDKTVITPEKLGESLFNSLIPRLEYQFPDVTFKKAGELEEFGNIKGGLIKALIFTCILVYSLLAIPLKSYWQPLIIMSVIPFGFIGAALGHLIMDVPLSILSFFGMLALTGVVLNDSLVMLTSYNQAREGGDGVNTALKKAGLSRFKAIFLTTTTTVAGLTPLMLETSEQAQYLIPAAISLAFGEIFATAITLILIPILIVISHDIKQLFFTQKNIKQESGGMVPSKLISNQTEQDNFHD